MMKRLTRGMTRSLAAVTAALLLAACATIPEHGAVHTGGQDAPDLGDVGQIAAGPSPGVEPDAIVRGFLMAAQAGPHDIVPFSVARDYLTGGVRASWRPYSQVLILDGSWQISEPETTAEQAHLATVTVAGNVVATVDDRGVYTELAVPVTHETSFHLAQVDGEWRIGDLEDVLLIPAQLFGSIFHATRLYFPTTDLAHWAVDHRWFPQQTWRTNAVQELLTGPPEWMLGAVTQPLPPGTTLAISAVTEDETGAFRVPISDHIDNASAEARAIFAEQVRATVSSGVATARIVVEDRFGPLTIGETELPSEARTPGLAQVLRSDRLWTLSGRHLDMAPPWVNVLGQEALALAISPQPGSDLRFMLLAGADPVDPEPEPDETDEADDATPEPDETTDDEYYEPDEVEPTPEPNTRLVRLDVQPTTILEGVDLIAPSVDRLGFIWSGEAAKGLTVLTEHGDATPVSASWLADRHIDSIAVAPDGARIAIVSRGADGVHTQVAGIMRDQTGRPTILSSPHTVATTVSGARQAVWQTDTVLAILAGMGEATNVYQVGIGGLPGSVGGLARRLADLPGVQHITATVGSGALLALDAEYSMYLLHASPIWSLVYPQVTLVQYPG